MTGHDKAKEIANKLKTAEELAKESEVKETELAKNQLDLVRNNPEMSKMYNDNAGIGSENLASALPILKIHATGKSTTNQLADGGEPENGYFYYKPTQQQYKSVTAHILTISRGFRAEGLQGKKDVFHQLVGGVILNDGDEKPFVMYMTGTKLQNLWNFGKEASKYTKAKPLSIPLFTLEILLTSQKHTSSFGNSWIVNFEIVKDENGFPKVVSDPGKFIFLRDMVDMVKTTIDQIISAKSTEETEVVTPLETKPVTEAVEEGGPPF